MRISAISDVHVKSPHDPADQLLLKFLSHPLVKESDYVLLLGDIFDLMCGPHPQYLTEYKHLFAAMDELVRAGKNVRFIEGNHDVHLEKLFRLLWPEGEVRPGRGAEVVSSDGKTYYFSHGDEFDVHNEAYHRYMRFIYTPPLRFVANHVMPYRVLNYIGERASVASRKKGSKSFDADKVRSKFRVGVEEVVGGKDYDFVIGGHSHVKDNYLLPNGKTVYLNNGYALKSKTFIFIEDNQPRFVDF